MKKYTLLNRRRKISSEVFSWIMLLCFIISPFFLLGFNWVAIIMSLLFFFINRRTKVRSLIYSIEDTGDSLAFEYYDLCILKKEYIEYKDMNVHYGDITKRDLVILSKTATSLRPRHFIVVCAEIDKDWLMSVFDAHGIYIPYR